MEAKVKCLLLLALLLFFSCAGFERVNGAGECGCSTTDIVAFQMAPCASASQDVNVAVLASCCSEVLKIGQNPKCLCAVMLSNIAKSASVNLGVAVTIPKRYEIANGPARYKCEGYTLPSKWTISSL